MKQDLVDLQVCYVYQEGFQDGFKAAQDAQAYKEWESSVYGRLRALQTQVANTLKGVRV